MGFLDSLRAWLRREGAELADASRDLENRLDADLSRRERRLDETPEEAMERLQQEIADDRSLTDLEDRIAATQARADAVAELDEDARPSPTDDDVLDLESEED